MEDIFLQLNLMKTQEDIKFYALQMTTIFYELQMITTYDIDSKYETLIKMATLDVYLYSIVACINIFWGILLFICIYAQLGGEKGKLCSIKLLNE